MTHFREVQPFTKSPVFWVAIAGVALSIAVPLATPLVRDHLSGPIPVMFLIPAAVLLWFLVMRLETEVREDGVHLLFRALWFPKTFPWDRIERAEAVEYRPIRQYGGWGIRCGRQGWAWNVHGSKAVMLHLRNGKSFLIGSQEAERLAAAIRDRLPANTARS